jgi:photosynthesis system II assembly factor YCF48-like protein
MALDDRDRSFEKALALRLRANLPAAGCPDAETLAAYHERSLTSDELNSWKSHIASCANCQQVLAHLEALDEVPLGALAGQESSSEASNLDEAGARVAVTHDARAVAVGKRASTVSVAQFPKHQGIRNWRWIVPAGAIAAGLIAWVAVHENQPAAVLPAAKIEIAQNRPPGEESRVAAPTPAKPEALDNSAAFAKPVGPTGNRGSVSSAPQNRRDNSVANAPATIMAAPPAPTSRSEAFARESEKAQLSAKAQSGQDTKISGLAGGISTGAAGAAVGGMASVQKEKKFDEPAPQDQAMNYAAAPAPAAPKPQSARQSGAPSEQKDEKDLQAAQSAGTPAPSQAEAKQAPQSADTLTAKPQALTETVEVTSEAAAAPVMRMARTRAPRTVATPDGKVIWRLGFGGLIEQSLDGGQTWTPQTSGTTETLVLGSAPSEQVCWVISVSGTILRTTDGGATWTRVVSPIPQNLGLIRASDALHATVWDTSRRQIFQTADGGATWTAVTVH